MKNLELSDSSQLSCFDICGIYAIQCSRNDHIYIGLSNNIIWRIGSHIRELKAKRNRNQNLQNDYDKFGIDNFRLFILHECASKQLKLWEDRYIWQFIKDGYILYNSCYEDRKNYIDIHNEIPPLTKKERLQKTKDILGKEHWKMVRKWLEPALKSE